jgi:hypothetical protein
MTLRVALVGGPMEDGLDPVAIATTFDRDHGDGRS